MIPIPVQLIPVATCLLHVALCGETRGKPLLFVAALLVPEYCDEVPLELPSLRRKDRTPFLIGQVHIS